MTDHIETLKERLKKAEAKASRARKSLESAEKEASDLATALRVMQGITSENNKSGGSDSPAPTADRQLKIAEIVPIGAEHAISPVDIFPSYKASTGDDINIDTFRTTIWRMKGKVYEVGGMTYTIHGERHGYWKVPVSDDEEDLPFDPNEYDPVEAAERDEIAIVRPWDSYEEVEF